MKLLLATLYIWLCRLAAVAFFAVLLGVVFYMAVEDWPIPLYALGIVLGLLFVSLVVIASYARAKEFINQKKKDN